MTLPNLTIGNFVKQFSLQSNTQIVIRKDHGSSSKYQTKKDSERTQVSQKDTIKLEPKPFSDK